MSSGAAMREHRARIVLVAPGAGSAGGMYSMVESILGSQLADRYGLELLSLHRDGGVVVKLRAAAGGFGRLAGVLIRNPPDLMWVHTTLGASIQRKSLVVLMAAARGIPCILHVHSERVLDYLDQAPRPVRALAERAIRASAAVIVLDEAWIPRLNSFAPARYVYIPNPVDVPTTIKPRTPGLILQVGRLIHVKRALNTLSAFIDIAEQIPEATLHYAGSGPQEAELRQRAAAAGLAARVVFHGWMSRPDALGLMSTASVVVLPSSAEGLPMALLEAMARGVPVVSTPVGGIPALLSDGAGIILGVDDVGALADALLNLLRDPESARQLGASGRDRVASRYSTTQVVAELTRLFEDLLNSGNR